MAASYGALAGDGEPNGKDPLARGTGSLAQPVLAAYGAHTENKICQRREPIG